MKVLRRSLTVAATVAFAAVAFATPAFAWQTQQSAKAYCEVSDDINTGNAIIEGTFKNTEPKAGGKHDMLVSMSAAGQTTTPQVVAEGQSITIVVTTTAPVSAGTVTFNLTWVNGSGKDSRKANYGAVESCPKPTPTPTPTPTQSETPSPTPSDTPTSTPTPSKPPVVPTTPPHAGATSGGTTPIALFGLLGIASIVGIAFAALRRNRAGAK